MSNPILAKIKALLAKTTQNGCTEAEAFAALAKASELMEQYSISPEALREAQTENAGFTSLDPDAPHGIRAKLRTAIALFTGCKAYQDLDNGGKIVFCGLRSDRDLAEWLLESLSQFVMNELTIYLLDNYDRERHNAKHLANGFVVGAVERITVRLAALRGARPASTGTELVVAKAALINAALQGAGIRLSRSKSVSLNYHHEGIVAGRATGDRASFGRPVSSGGPLRIGSSK